MPSVQPPHAHCPPARRTVTGHEQDAPDALSGRERIALYESIMNATLSGVWVSDKNDTIQFANRAMETIAGISSPQIIGANLLTSFDTETIRHFLPYYHRAKRTLAPVSYEAVPIRTPAGRATYQSGSLVPIVRNGCFDGMITTVDDVTRRVMLEQEQQRRRLDLESMVAARTSELQRMNEQLRSQEAALHRSREFLERIIEGSLDGIVVTEIDGRITKANHAYCDMHCVDQAEVLGTHVIEDFIPAPGTSETTAGDIVVIDADALHRDYEHVRTALFASGRSASHKTFRRRWDGRLFHAEISASLLYNDRQAPIGAVGIIRDTTSQYRWERRMSAVNRELEHRVRERTAELELSRQRLEETNTAMKVLLSKREQEQLDMADSIYANMQHLIMPCLTKLRHACADRRQTNLLDILTTSLNDLTSPFAKTLCSSSLGLTATETRIVELIRTGKRSSDIAAHLSISVSTLQSHRKNIRRKLGLHHTKKNLYSYLQSIS
jgi:PAS domain S-box-containing protein